MKTKKRLNLLMVLASIFLFGALGAFAQSPLTDNCCTARYGTGPNDYFTVCPDPVDFQKETTCSGQKACVYTYNVYGNFPASAWYQSLPCFPKEVNVINDTCDGFPSVDSYACGEGIPGNNVPCFGQNLYETKVVKYVSMIQGNPPKFKIVTDQCGLGKSSLRFVKGNSQFNCVGGLPGPAYAEATIVKNVIEYHLVGDTKVKFDINYRDCTFKAYDDITGNEYIQFPIQDIQLSFVGSSNSAPAMVKEGWSHGKCDRFTLAYEGSTCGTSCLGSYCIKVPLSCK